MLKQLHLTKFIALFTVTLFSEFCIGQTNLIQNPTADFYTFSVGENTDAFDMTPSSTLQDNTGVYITSPYKYHATQNPNGWDNWALKSYVDSNYTLNSRPASTYYGTYEGSYITRGLKFLNTGRRIYQLVPVTKGINYTFSVETRSESETTIKPEIFILNNEIITEENIDKLLGESPDVDGYLAITNDVNSSRGSATENTFTTSIINFTASTSIVVVYMRSLGSIDNNTEVYVDNFSLVVNTSGLTNTLISSSEFSTFPNPVKDVLNIESADHEVSSVTVKNMLGQELISSNDTEQLNVSSLSSGVYLLVIKSGSKVAIKKFIKQ